MGRLAKLKRAWPCAASAALMLLAFPPFNLGLLVFVALVPWILSLRESSGREAWRSGYCFGFLYGLGQLFWIAQLTGHWMGSIAVGLIPWLIAALLYALYFGWAGVLIRHAWSRHQPWAIPVVWVGVEVVRSYIPVFAFPWGLTATPLWPYIEIIQTARVGSIYLVSAWVALINAILALVVIGTEYRRLRPYASVALAGFAGSLLILGYDAPATPMRVSSGQPAVDLAFGDQTRTPERLRTNIGAISDQASASGSKLLVLPEGISEAPTMPPQAPFTVRPDLPVVFGGRRGTGPTYQSAFSFDGRAWHYADKTRLVIFGEFVPGRTIFPFIAETMRLPTGDMSAGSNVAALPVDGHKVGPVICFEALFPDIAYRQALNGANLLAVMSVDDWFMDSSAPDQLRAASVWRAVETGLPLVRSASTGYSLVCDPHGRLLGQLPLRKPGGLTVSVPIPQRPPFTKVMPVFPILCGITALAFPWLRRRPKTEKQRP